MADTKISALTAATTPLAGTEVLPIVQGGVTKQVSVADLTAGRAVSAASLTLTTALAATSGGTGQSSYAVGDLLYASTTTALSKLADVATGNALISGGVGVAPAWGKVGLTTHVTGTLAVGNGGTGMTAVTATQILFGYTAGALSASSNFVYDYTNIRVGIGTSTPWSQASILTPSGGTEGYFGVKDSVFGGDVRFGKASGINNNGIAGTWTNNDFLIYAAGVNSFTFDANSNIVQKVAAKGVNFTANTPAAGMTSQLLNWYEEGTWTPTVIGTSTAGTATYSIRKGYYTRIGRNVTIYLTLSWSAGTGTGDLKVSGLPFTANSDLGGSLAFGLVDGVTLIAGNYPTAVVDANATTISFLQSPTGGGAANGIAYDAAAYIILSGTYFV